MDDHKEEDFRRYGIRLGEYCSKLLPCLTGDEVRALNSRPRGHNCESRGSRCDKRKAYFDGWINSEYSLARACSVFRFWQSLISISVSNFSWVSTTCVIRHLLINQRQNWFTAPWADPAWHIPIHAFCTALKLVHCSLSRPQLRALTRQLQTDSFIHWCCPMWWI